MEIDGKRTEIDVYTAPPDKPIEISSDKNWRHIATYEQKLRYNYNPDKMHNSLARYIDGYIDFGEATRRGH